MARIRKQTEETPDTSTLGGTPIDGAASEPEGGAFRRKRIVIPIREDGYDISRVDSADREALAKILRPAEAATSTVDPAMVAMLIMAVGSMEAAILASRFGVDRQRCMDIVGPHEPLKTLMATSAAGVLAKYNVFGRWGDEIALLSLVATWQVGVMEAIRHEGKRADSGSGITAKPSQEHSRGRGATTEVVDEIPGE